MNTSIDRPLVSFVLMAYNQEQFIREAVEGALAQDYSPLEVILSDDCSTDGTFAIMEKLVVEYRGPHRVVLNKNESNLGVGGHVNRVVEIANGELLVGAAGDDISRSDRVSVTVRSWLEGERRATSLYSAVQPIDEFGQDVPGGFATEVDWTSKEIVQRGAGPLGATHSFSRSLMTHFGPLNREVTCEDQTIGFRSALIGAFAYINEPLVQYRIHSSSITSRERLLKSVSPRDLFSSFGAQYARSRHFHRQNLVDALRLPKIDPSILHCLDRAIAVDDLGVALFSDRTGFSQWIFNAVSAVCSGVSPDVIARLLIKRSAWPIYARYYDRKRRRVVARRTKQAPARFSSSWSSR